MPVTKQTADVLKELGDASRRARDVFLSEDWQSVYTLSEEKQDRLAHSLREVAVLAWNMAESVRPADEDELKPST